MCVANAVSCDVSLEFHAVTYNAFFKGNYVCLTLLAAGIPVHL